MTTINANGYWHVTTEGDCEGRSIKNLGVHQGYLDEIAFALADQACYGLKFDPVTVDAYRARAPRTEVNVSLGIESRTWDMTPDERAAYFARMLAGRDVSVVPSNYYACAKLVNGASVDAQERARKKATALAGLAKLTPEERVALGLDVNS